MSDLKVWVDGKERVIRGVSEGTTCESVVLVLAKAAGKSGKFALLEKWRDFERILPRNENPLKCLEAWGAYKKDVCLILHDDDVPKKTIDLSKASINLDIDNKDDIIKRSVDCRSLENLTALQERKLTRLSRGLEIFNLQFSCWDDSDEKFLYLTEDEIIEDFTLKLSKALKLQAKELDEFDSWQTEVDNLRNFHVKTVSKFELYFDKISQLENEIADTCLVVQKLVSKIENIKREGDKTRSDNSDVQNELRVLEHELEEQKRLSRKQDVELEVIKKSVSELNSTFKAKASKIELLKNEITSDEVFYDLDEHFRPLSAEEESKLYKHSLSGESVDEELSTDDNKGYDLSSTNKDGEIIPKVVPEVESRSNGSRVEQDTGFDLRKSSTGSPEEFFRNWSASTRLANSPLKYHHLVNGGKRKGEHSWSSFPSKSANFPLYSKIDFQTSKKCENGKILVSAPSSEKMDFPSSERENKILVEQSSDAKVATFLDSTSSMMQEPSSSLKQSEATIRVASNGYHPKQNSTNQTKLKPHRDKKTDSVDDKLLLTSFKKEELLIHQLKSTKPPTKPKPVKNSSLSSALQKNKKQSSSLSNHENNNSRLDSVLQEHRKPEMSLPVTLPKPKRKTSTGAQMSSSFGNISLLSNKTLDETFLVPPTVEHKRNHNRKVKPLNHVDLDEEGVFV